MTPAELRNLLARVAPLLPLACGEYDGESEHHEVLGAQGSNGYPREVPLIGGFYARLNRDLAVAAVNALPALLDVAEAAQKQIDACTFCGGTGVFEIGAVARMQSACPACKDLRRAVDRLGSK